MWRPAERIKYAPSPGRRPSAAEAAASRLFSPIKVGDVTLRQRTWVPAMVPWRASAEGFVSQDVLDWYERFARGRPGALVVEATGIRDVPSGPLLRIGHDRFLPGLRELVRVVREASGGETRLLIQIIDFLTIRRRPDPSRYFAEFLVVSERHRRAYGRQDAADSEVRVWLAARPLEELAAILDARELEALDYGYRERVTDLQLAQIRALPSQLPNLFADAARRARESGFDGVELQYAHAYTMASFEAATNGVPLQGALVRSGIAWVINDGSKTTPVLVCSECAATGNIGPDSSISAETCESGSQDGTLPWIAPTCHICVQELEKRIASREGA